MNSEIPKNTAKELRRKSLQELAHQKIVGDTDKVAAKLGLSIRTVQQYISGVIDDLDTGKKVFKELRSIIIKRENDIKRLVA